MKIAIIGSGIAGLTAAYYTNQHHDIQVFEAESWIGGHTHTVKVDGLNIDTGFIVFNDRTYPQFQKLMDELGVKYRPTEMSFAVRNDHWDLEYNGNNLNSLFADRRNLINPKFYRLLSDILRFNKMVKSGSYDADLSLGEFIQRNNFSKWFSHGYILPMGSAIWSMGISEMLEFPLEFFAKFFINHGLLEVVNRPQWFTIEGGSSQYIEPLTRDFNDKIRLNSRVKKVIRSTNGVEIHVDEEILAFDKVIFACHSDQALALLAEPTKLELDILGNIKYSDNEVVLHTDTSLLPKRKLAHASWNYLISDNSDTQATLTYNMNILQGLHAHRIYCVTLNSTELINPNLIRARYNYSHPIYSRQAVAAQQRFAEISGHNNTYFCGAYWKNGFHEDGVVSALRVCQQLGVKIV